MASEKPPTASEALANLKQQLTCPVCLDRYTQPRTLPCLHSFCHGCLGRFPVEVKKDKHFITCPVCRQTTQQPDKGVSGFQSVFLINNLLELHQMLEKVSGSQQNNCENCHKEQATGYCKQCSVLLCQTCIDKHNGWVAFKNHQILGVDDVAANASKLVPIKEQPTMECSSHGEPLKVYCDTCEELICHLCTVNHHRDHKCDAITDAFPKHQQKIVDSLEKVKKKLAAITTAVQAVEAQEGGFLEQVRAVRKEIEARVQQLMKLLQESERQLMRELDQIMDAYIEKLSVHKKKADKTITQLKSCYDFVDQQIRIGSQQEILVLKRQMVDRMADVCSLRNLQPLEKTTVKFVKNASVLKACRSLGSVFRHGQFKTTSNKTRFCLCNAAPLSFDQVSCLLFPVNDPKQVFKSTVNKVALGTFEACCSPPTSGLHELIVKVGGTDILSTRINVEVTPRKAGETFTNLSSPCGLAITREGHLVVAESGNKCITIIDPTKRKDTKNFGKNSNEKLKFNSLSGVAVAQNSCIIVADWGNHCLQVLTANGALKATVGSMGSQPLQFKYPQGVAVHHNGQVFVVDSDNHRVQVLNADLTYSHCFGNNGVQPGEFNGPHGIAIDADGMVYVADYGNKRVQKFTAEGKLLATIYRKEENGRLNHPLSLCVDDIGILYVIESETGIVYNSNTVSMFSSAGKFLGYIGNSDGSSFNGPRYIVSDKTGRLYISESNRVITY